MCKHLCFSIAVSLVFATPLATTKNGGRDARDRAPISAPHPWGGSPHPGRGNRPGIRAQLRRREAGWGAGGGELAARRRTNVMRRDGPSSKRSRANLPRRSQPPQGGQRQGRRGAGQDFDEIRGVVDGGTLGRCGAWTGDTCWHQCPVTGAGRDQRRHSTAPGGESRFREGRQEGRDVEDRTP